MKHEFITPHARWTGEIPDSPSNFAKKALTDAKAAATSAFNLEQSLTDCGQPVEEVEAIVALMRDASTRLAGLTVNLIAEGEADRAWEARVAAKEERRKQIATANAAREFAEHQAQQNPWRNK